MKTNTIIKNLNIKDEDIHFYSNIIKKYNGLINNFVSLKYKLSEFDYYIGPNNYPENINTRKFNYPSQDYLMRYGKIPGKRVLYIIMDKYIKSLKRYSGVYLELFENHINYTENPEILSKKVSKKYLDFFKENFLEHKEIIEKIKELGYIEEKIFFREVLSGDYDEIEGFDDEKIEKSIRSGRSELVPVTVFYNGKERFCLELHYSGNPI